MSARKSPAHHPYRVWSWHHNAWWMVDHGSEPGPMARSAAKRQTFVRTPQLLRNRAQSVVLNPQGRFIVTSPGQTPEECWALQEEMQPYMDSLPWPPCQPDN
jgi:hypothetical protein